MGYFYPNFRKNEDKLYTARQEMAYNAVLDVEFSDEGDEPVTLEEAKSWLKIDSNYDDAIIEELITSARIMCEEYTNISFVERTVIACLNNSLGGILLPYGPVVGDVTAIEDEDETAITEFTVRGVKFKELHEPTYDYVKVTYDAGYTELPKKLKTAVLMQISWSYENRGDVKADQLSPQVRNILKSVRRV